MGYISDVSDLIRAVTNVPGMTVRDIDNRMTDHKSFARGANDGTLQFPCLVSDSIPIDMASTISRTLERTYASFVQVFFSHNNVIDISVDKTPAKFLKRYHGNINLEATELDLYHEHCVDDDPETASLMERIYNGTTKAYMNVRENSMIVFNFTDKFSPAVFESHKAQLEEHLKDIDYLPIPNIGNSQFYAKEALGDEEITDIQVDMIKKGYANQLDIRRDHDKLMHGDKLRVPAMTDNDVKKANDFQPYTMQVRLMAVNDQKEFVQFMDFIVGIKVVLHNIRSDEMIVNIKNSLQNNGVLFNFIRWTTGEKSLIKDLLLKVNDVKLDVANRSRGASPWWLALKRMKETSRAQAAFLSRTQFVPQATIVLSAYEVDIIQQQTGVSLRDPRFAKKLMDALFLMNFVIVDDGTRTVDVLYDRSPAFQTYALETLEREVTASSNKIGRELTRMISR